MIRLRADSDRLRRTLRHREIEAVFRHVPDDMFEDALELGAGDGAVVVARTGDELADYAGKEEPLTILIEGQLTGPEKLRVASNKTLLGVGASASITGVELSLNDVSNVIIRNLTMSGARDTIALRGSHHVWVDHCDLSACDDGLLDILVGVQESTGGNI